MTEENYCYVSLLILSSKQKLLTMFFDKKMWIKNKKNILKKIKFIFINLK